MNKIKLKWPINLEKTLLGGQSFRWSKQDDESYTGVFFNIVWEVKATKTYLTYKVLSKTNLPLKKYDEIVRKYFRLDDDLDVLYKKWINAHKHFEMNQKNQLLISQLDQDIVENVFSFICSQNNNIARITSLVLKLCSSFGDLICTVNSKDYYTFPTLETLSQKHVEEKLRELGFGYRAKYIQKSAEEILELGGLSWLEDLRHVCTYQEAHERLMSLNGIGPKVADCICLMSLNHLEAVPVDTHIIQIAKHYIPDIDKQKTMNIKKYREIGNEFRKIYGEKAGAAQTVLFCEELNKFKNEEKNESLKKKKKIKS